MTIATRGFGIDGTAHTIALRGFILGPSIPVTATIATRGFGTDGTHHTIALRGFEQRKLHATETPESRRLYFQAEIRVWNINS